MTPLETPLNFVFQSRYLWPEIAAGEPESVTESRFAERATSSADVWIAATYVIFRQAGHPVTWSNAPKPGAVNVVGARSFGRRQRDIRSFVLCARGDAHDMAMANFVLNQNGLNGNDARQAWVPHWPQFDLKPRDPARGDRIERLTFKGEVVNLDPRFRDEAFLDAMRRLGMTFDVALKTQGQLTDWTDYRDADLVLAARNMTIEDARAKPASKLVNAWIAGVPALLGPEPAFRELRRSELDYIEVTTPDAVLAAIETLKAEPTRYRAMIDNGLARAAEFSREAILEYWVEVMNGPVRAAFEAWQAQPTWRKAAWWAVAQIREGRSRERYRRGIRQGPRLYGEDGAAA